MSRTFANWIDTFISEKGIDPETTINVDGPSGLNVIPVACLVDAMKSAPETEQRGIRDTIVKIDFCNGDVMHFFRHLAGAIAQ